VARLHPASKQLDTIVVVYYIITSLHQAQLLFVRSAECEVEVRTTTSTLSLL
jgi:hypothetical protein